MRDNVARVRRLLDSAEPETPESRVRRDFQLFEFNTDVGPVLDQSPRARMQREILRIARWYSWEGEIARALDADGVGSLESLPIERVERLLGRMVRLETCAQEGLDAPDAPPAR